MINDVITDALMQQEIEHVLEEGLSRLLSQYDVTCDEFVVSVRTKSGEIVTFRVPAEDSRMPLGDFKARHIEPVARFLRKSRESA